MVYDLVGHLTKTGNENTHEMKCFLLTCCLQNSISTFVSLCTGGQRRQWNLNCLIGVKGGASSCVVFRGFLHIALIFFSFFSKTFLLDGKTKSLNNAYLIM